MHKFETNLEYNTFSEKERLGVGWSKYTEEMLVPMLRIVG